MWPEVAGTLRSDSEEGGDRSQHDRRDKQRRERPATAVTPPNRCVRDAHGLRLGRLLGRTALLIEADLVDQDACLFAISGDGDEV